MGVAKNLTYDKYPEQYDENVGARVNVIFHYDTDHMLPGTILRDDKEDPYRTVIQLDDGRIVLAEECQWSNMSQKDAEDKPRPESVPLYKNQEDDA